MRIASPISAAAAALLLAACSSDSESRLVGPSSTLAERPAAIAIVSGNEQEAKAGERLPQPLVIRVTGASGSGIRGAALSFEVSGDAGLNGKDAPGPTRLSSLTDANGNAQVIVEPYDIGPISVTARVGGTQLPPVTFTATATSLIVELRAPQSFGAYAAFYGPCRCSRTVNTVTVPIGTPVEWTSVDASPYTITTTSVPERGAPFDSGTLTGSSRFRFVPTVAGTWQYRDNVSGLTATLNAK
jgi:hypothetical protein